MLVASSDITRRRSTIQYPKQMYQTAELPMKRTWPPRPHKKFQGRSFLLGTQEIISRQQSNKPRNTPGERTANYDSKGKRISRRLSARRRARRVALGVRPRVRTLHPHVVRPPRAGARVRGWSEGAARAERRTGREKKQGGGGEEHAAHERFCSTAAVKNHPQRTRAARVARASPVAPRAPLPRSARSGDRREDARQGRRAATGQEKNQGREERFPATFIRNLQEARSARASATSYLRETRSKTHDFKGQR